jgi:hypothetical protein
MMDDLKSDEENREKFAEAEKAEKEAESTAAAKAEELRTALETKTEQWKSTLGDLPKP